MRYQGKLSGWNDERGYGFVVPNGGGEKAFVHIKAFASRPRRPAEGDLITYELEADRRRGLCAREVRLVRGRHRPSASPATGWSGIAFAGLFCSCVIIAWLAGRLPAAVPGAYLAASTVTFLAYALDKSAARNSRWRTRESTLHLFALIGGWPGALLAQKTLRHKSSKPAFQAVFRITVLLNCCALAWFFTAAAIPM